jgi:hypothetical protein
VSRPAKRVIKEAKARVETIALAARLCGPGKMRKVGDKWTARCPLPDHEDKSPSFTVYPSDRGWFCFGCHRGGDVVELARFAWRYTEGDVAMAAAQLLHEFGHEVPPRPPAWYAKHERQKPARDVIEHAKVEHLRDLVFRLVWTPWLKLLPEATREEAAQDAWAKSLTLARMLYERRREA